MNPSKRKALLACVAEMRAASEDDICEPAWVLLRHGALATWWTSHHWSRHGKKGQKR